MAKTERAQPAGERATASEPRERSGARGPRERPSKRVRGTKSPGTRRQLTSEVARAVAAAQDKKASNVVVLDLRKTPAFTDFFVLCSAQNQRQVKAIADAVEESLRAAKIRPAHVEGYERGEWILMDFFTFVVHVLAPQTREFYSLERLWGDADRIEIEDVNGGSAPEA
jgi:ribosome-associated protein